jgi:predicted alpha/beta-hydrolase family hydrolase
VAGAAVLVLSVQENRRVNDHRELRIDVSGGTIPASLEGPPDSSTLIVLAHGAGAGKDHPFMETFAAGLAERGHRVARFDFLYTSAGRKAPDRQPILEQTYRDVLAFLRAEVRPERMFVGGKSMGGRIASHVAAGPAAVEVDGLFFLGYPLHPPGRPDRMRDAHLPSIGAPMLFVEGTRDPFCPLETLRPILAKLPRAELLVVEDGDHSFKVRKSFGRSTEEALQEAIDAVATWISNQLM